MRLIATILLLSFFLLNFSNDSAAQRYRGHRQRGYGQMAFSVYGNDEFPSTPGISLGAGALLGNNVTTGAGFDIYMFDGFNKNKLRFSQAYADFRAYYSGLEKAGPYVAFQPGVVLLKKEPNVRAKSGFSMNVMAGFFVRFRRSTGITASFGYSLLTYSAENEQIRKNGVKFNMGFCF
jgi:hypothetical protein